ncbi:MAG: PEP-CTERM sorting domain-containing protein [Planctomycetes bacterium]|nr:PEP-CTERM sorting domain-containing protein [Planctomycetota bacterium]
MQSPSQPAPPDPRIAAGCAIIVFGVLPFVGLIAELVTGALSQFHLLFPSTAHRVVAFLAVTANLLLQAGAWHAPRHLSLRAAATGFVTGTSLLYALVELAAADLIIVAIFFAGLGVLAMAPYWCLLGLIRLWPKLVSDWRAAGRSQARLLLLAGGAAVLPVVWAVWGNPETSLHPRALQQLALAMREGSRDGAEIERLAQAVRRAPIAPQLVACQNGIDLVDYRLPLLVLGRPHTRWWFLDYFERAAVSAEAAQLAMYRAHGIDWRELPGAWEQREYESARRRWTQTVWRGSRFEVQVDRDAAVARVDWLVTASGKRQRPTEGIFELQLPTGAVASGLSLWIGDVERPAAFAAQERVQRAYEAVTAKARDPALLRELSPGHLRLRLFPLEETGPPMRARVRCTVPLRLGKDGNELLLPRVSSDAPAPREGHEVVIDGLPEPFRKTLDDAHLALPIAVPRGATKAVSTDADGLVVQHLLPAPPPRPLTAAVLVVEASTTVLQRVPDLATVLDAFAAATVCNVLVVHGDGYAERSGRADDAALRAWLTGEAGPGGVDARAALLRARQLAAQEGRRVFWLHGACAMVDDRPRPPADNDQPIFAVALHDGPNRVRDDAAVAPWLLDLAPGRAGTDGLRALAAAAQRGVSCDAFGGTGAFLRVCERADVAPADAAIVDDQLARLWAATAARRSRGMGKDDEAMRLAARYRLVTAGAGAVVLEKPSDYEDHGLDATARIGAEPQDLVGTSPVPEPGTLLLVGSGLILACCAQRRRSTAAASRRG